MSQPADWSDLGHLKTCIWKIIALIHTGSVNLTKWSMYIPCRGIFAQSRQRRIQRRLNNSRINVHRIYKPLIKAALAGWKEESIFLTFDTSLFWDKYCLIGLAVVHRGRALPVLPTFAEYGLRFDIEENFLDDQSAGWNVQRSMIRDVCA